MIPNFNMFKTVWGAIGSPQREQVPKATEIPTSEAGVNGTKVSLMTQTKLWARREEKIINSA